MVISYMKCLSFTSCFFIFVANFPFFFYNIFMKKLNNWMKTILLLLGATLIAFLFYVMAQTATNIAIVYMLFIVLVARSTDGYLYGIFSSFVGVIAVNYFFTEPMMVVDFTKNGYPFTFIGMLGISLITSAATTHLKQQQDLLLYTEKEKMHANFLRAISHDLRTPLTGIIGSANVYKESGSRLGEEEKLHIVEDIYEEAFWLLNMVENLLSVTKIEEDFASLNKSSEPLEEIIAESINRLRKRYPSAMVVPSIPEALLLVSVDAILIEQVILNLLENAVKYSHSTKPIEIRASVDGSFALIEVYDYGDGLTQAQLKGIRYGYGDRKTRENQDFQGIGIGLSICQTIISAHGGSFQARNHTGGAVFSFTLPLSQC